MKRYWISTLVIICLALSWSTAAHAKWWIFGKSEEAVSIDYLYINQIAFEESEQQITLYKQFLANGMVVVRGKAQASKGGIGVVSISLDDRKTWIEAKLSSGGHFELQFKPEMDRTYDLYIRAMDTLGKTNNVADTHKKLIVSDQNMSLLIKEILDQMVQAYEAENPTAFMAHVSEDFAGGELVLDNAVRRDFTYFDNIDLRVTISNIAAGDNGRIYVSLTYARSVVSARAGTPLLDQGITEFVFVQGERPKVYAMKYPLIFGLSDAANVATGTLISEITTGTLIVDDQGNAEVVSMEDAIDGLENGFNTAGIPAPTNLRISDGQLHHYVDLEFDSTLDFAAAQTVYETVVEEAMSQSGPWVEVDKRAYDTFVRLSTDNIASYSGFLYYRVKIERISNGEQSRPSNVVALDNR